MNNITVNKIKCQRDLFNIPEHIVYLNTAYMSPLSNKVQKAILNGSIIETQPWRIDPKLHFFSFLNQIKISFACLLYTSDAADE